MALLLVRPLANSYASFAPLSSPTSLRRVEHPRKDRVDMLHMITKVEKFGQLPGRQARGQPLLLPGAQWQGWQQLRVL